MNPGDFNRNVTIQTITATRDAFGAEIETWGDVAVVWAKIEPLSGGESYSSDNIQSQSTHRITVYYRTDVTAKQRIVYDGFAYDILLVKEVGFKEGLELSTRWASEVVT